APSHYESRRPAWGRPRGRRRRLLARTAGRPGARAVGGTRPDSHPDGQGAGRTRRSCPGRVNAGRPGAAGRDGARRPRGARRQGAGTEDRLRPGEVWAGLGRRRSERLRYPQRHPCQGSLGGSLQAPHPELRGAGRCLEGPLHGGDHIVRQGWGCPCRHRSRRGAGQCLGDGRPAAFGPGPAALRQRPAEPPRRRRAGQPAEGRRRCRDVAAAERIVPVRLRGPADGGQAQVPPMGDGRRTRRDRADPSVLPGPAASRCNHRSARRRPGRHTRENPAFRRTRWTGEHAANGGGDLRELLGRRGGRRRADHPGGPGVGRLVRPGRRRNRVPVL
ncbi:MAG: putative secreted protein, partial [uncultured Arthrobacter sp.]